MDVRGDMGVYIFVYGTLMRGIASPMSAYLAAHSDLVAELWLPGYLYDLGSYPGFVYNAGAQERVYGQVLALHGGTALLSRLDAYEGILLDAPTSGEYRRVVVQVTLPGSTVVDCGVYVYNRSVEGLCQIRGGDYRAYYETRRAHLEFIGRGR